MLTHLPDFSSPLICIGRNGRGREPQHLSARSVLLQPLLQRTGQHARSTSLDLTACDIGLLRHTQRSKRGLD